MMLEVEGSMEETRGPFTSKRSSVDEQSHFKGKSAPLFQYEKKKNEKTLRTR